MKCDPTLSGCAQILLSAAFWGLHMGWTVRMTFLARGTTCLYRCYRI